MDTALVIATLLLVLVTFLYMLHTKRLADETKKMANIMVREFELKVSPIVEINFSRSHGSGGFSYGLKIVNRGFFPVYLEEIILDWWYINNITTLYSIRKKINKLLSRQEPIETSLDFSDGELQKEEYPESKNLQGTQLGKITAGNIYALCKDIRGIPQKIEGKTLDFLF